MHNVSFPSAVHLPVIPTRLYDVICTTSYGMEDPRFECLHAQDIYLFSKNVQTDSGAHSASIQWVPQLFTQE